MGERDGGTTCDKVLALDVAKKTNQSSLRKKGRLDAVVIAIHVGDGELGGEVGQSSTRAVFCR